MLNRCQFDWVLLGLVWLSIAGAGTAAAKRLPTILDETSWTQVLEGEWMLNLYAPWCSSCRIFEPEWAKFADWSDDLAVNVASADVSKNPALSGRFMVRSLPTIYHIKDGVFRIYTGRREHVALINYIEERAWDSVEPISPWLDPSSLAMTILAHSTKLSLFINDIHRHLVDNVGLPSYASYLVFGLSAVVLGALLGIVIVFMIELVQMFVRGRSSGAKASTSKASGKAKKDADAGGGGDSDSHETTTNSDTKADADKETVRKRTVRK